MKYLIFITIIVQFLGCGSSSHSTENEDLQKVTLSYPPESNFTYIQTDTSVAKPAYLKSIIDPVFKSKVTRITDRATQSGNSHNYPKTQSYNSNSTLLRLGYRIYHADSFKESNITQKRLIDGQLTEMKWSTKKPRVFYGINRRGEKFSFQEATIGSDKISYKTLISFPKATYEELLLGKYEGNIDYHDKYVAFAARKAGENYLTAIVYDIEDNKTIVTKDFPDINWTDAKGDQVLDWISVSSLGNYILINWKDDPKNPISNNRSSIYQYDIDLNFIRKLANQGEHGDIGVDSHNKEVYVQFEFGPENGIWSYRLDDGKRTRLLPSKYNGGHVSCRNFKRKGWCYLSTSEEGYKEVFALKLDGSGIVNRFAQTHAVGFGSQVGVNPDGTKVLFMSNWGKKGDVVDTYQAEYDK